METVKEIPLEEHILEKEKVESESEKLKQNIDTPESIQEKLKLAKEKGKTVEIFREIPIGYIREKVYWIEEEFQKGILEEFYITESLEFFNKDRKILVNFSKFLDEHTTILTMSRYNKADYQRIERETKKGEKPNINFVEPLFIDKEGICKRISYGSLEEEGTRLSLLHEIGHSHEPDQLVWNTYNAQCQIEADFEKVRVKKRKGEKIKEIEKISLPKQSAIRVRLKGDKKAESISIKNFLQYHSLRAKEERYAWAYALKKIKELRKRGIEIEPLLDDAQKLEEYIHGMEALGCYEMDLTEKQLGNKTTPKIKGLYSHEFYRLFKLKKEKLI